jgi:uncharacterized membrane protein
MEEMDAAQQTAGQTADAATRDVEDNKDIAALSYVWIMSVFVFFAKHQSPFVRFHARQAMVLFALSIPLWFIPVIGRYLELVILALGVLGFLGAAQGLWKELPLIGAVSRGDKEGMRRGWKSITDASVQGWKKATKAAERHMETPVGDAGVPATTPSAAPATPPTPVTPVTPPAAPTTPPAAPPPPIVP